MKQVMGSSPGEVSLITFVPGKMDAISLVVKPILEVDFHLERVGFRKARHFSLCPRELFFLEVYLFSWVTVRGETCVYRSP